MEVEYSLNAEDLQAFTHYHRRLRNTQTQPSLRAFIGSLRAVFRMWVIGVIGMQVIAIVMMGLGVLLPAFLFQFHGEAIIASFMGLLFGWSGAMLFLSLEGYLNRFILKAQCQDPRNEWAVRDIRVVLSSTQLCTVARGATSMYEWSRVWHIGVTDKHVFLYIKRTRAIIIPRRAFRDQQHFEEFVALARQYQQARGQQEPKSTDIIAGLPPQSDVFTRPDAP